MHSTLSFLADGGGQVEKRMMEGVTQKIDRKLGRSRLMQGVAGYADGAEVRAKLAKQTAAGAGRK
jgi:hypothetical protein